MDEINFGKMRKADLSKWNEKAKKIKLDKTDVYIVKTDDFVPEDSEKLGFIHFAKKGESKDKMGVIVSDKSGKYYLVKPLIKDNGKEKKFIFNRKAGWAKVDGGYVIIAKVRKWLIALLTLLALLLLGLIIWKSAGMSPQDVFDYTTNQGQKKNKDNKAVLEYSSYGSVAENVVWKAGQRQQKITLFLPRYTYLKNSNGMSYEAENNIDAAAHIYVDLNKDGKFSNAECVYNPIDYDKQGNVTGFKHMLKPGYQINSVTIDRDIPKGKYKAQVLWTGVTRKTHELANPARFAFTLQVK